MRSIFHAPSGVYDTGGQSLIAFSQQVISYWRTKATIYFHISSAND